MIVTDFGIAKVMYGFPTSVSATVLGTPEYMSPEQASGEETDQRPWRPQQRRRPHLVGR